MRKIIKQYQLFFDLLVGMTEKEFKARYKYTVFGFLWVVVNPIIQMFVIGFIFRFFIREPIENYYFFLFSGLLAWNFFTVSLTKATTSIVYERALVKKAKFPHSVIPLSIIFSNFLHFLSALALFIVTLSLIGNLSLVKLPFTLLATFLLISFTVGLSLLTCSLNVRYRDVNFFTQAILIVWFYATPIVYSLKLISPEMLWIWNFNPLTTVIQIFQYSLVNASPVNTETLLWNLIAIGIIFTSGVLVFKSQSKYFDDLI